MSNLISDLERDTYKSAIQDLHDTFSRNITVWRQSTEVITNQNDDFDAFNDASNENVTYVSESKIFKARIKYIDRQDKEFELAVGGTTRATGSSIDLTQEFQLVRIKVDKEANDYIKDCEKITIDEQDFIPLTVPRAHGLFDIDWYTIYLRSRP
jgi:hypothetical protein